MVAHSQAPGVAAACCSNRCSVSCPLQRQRHSRHVATFHAPISNPHLQHAAGIALRLAAQVLLHLFIPQPRQVCHLDAALHQRLREGSRARVSDCIQQAQRVGPLDAATYACGAAGEWPSAALLRELVTGRMAQASFATPHAPAACPAHGREEPPCLNTQPA